MHEMSCLGCDLPTETAVMCAILNFRTFFADSWLIWTTLAATNFDRFNFFNRRPLNPAKGIQKRILSQTSLGAADFVPPPLPFTRARVKVNRCRS